MVRVVSRFKPTGSIRWALALALLATVFIASKAPVNAQATRTWVSGVGDDVNPCSRTAPCKTFAGAISKTAAGGYINCIDPGGFGGVKWVDLIITRRYEQWKQPFLHEWSLDTGRIWLGGLGRHH